MTVCVGNFLEVMLAVGWFSIYNLSYSRCPALNFLNGVAASQGCKCRSCKIIWCLSSEVPQCHFYGTFLVRTSDKYSPDLRRKKIDSTSHRYSGKSCHKWMCIGGWKYFLLHLHMSYLSAILRIDTIGNFTVSTQLCCPIFISISPCSLSWAWIPKSITKIVSFHPSSKSFENFY